MRILRELRRFMAGQQPRYKGDVFARHQAAFKTATILVRAYYWAVILMLSYLVQTWLERLTAAPTNILWPVFWVRTVSTVTAVHLIWSFTLLAALITAFFPEKRILRILLFIGLLQIGAFTSSFGKINHGLHAWIWVAFIFIFLPNGNWKQIEKSVAGRQQFLTIFWASQAILLGFYTLSGFWKINAVRYQIQLGQVHFLHPYGFAHTIAWQLHWMNRETVLGPIIIRYPLLGWPLSVGGVYIELFAFVAAFRPSLHRIWGIFLTLLHLGTILFMSVSFVGNIFLIGLLFVNSPFHPAQTNWKDMLYQLPLFGSIINLVDRGKPLYKTFGVET